MARKYRSGKWTDHPEMNRNPNLMVKKYPWDEWMDGSVWLAKQGVDFQVTPFVFMQYLHVKAGRTNHFVQTYRWLDGRHVQFCFYTGKKRPFRLRHAKGIVSDY